MQYLQFDKAGAYIEVYAFIFLLFCTYQFASGWYMKYKKEMDKLDAQGGDAGCRYIGLAARALNKTVFLVNDNRLTREQFIMFALADMMAYLEIGASLARKAVSVSNAGGSQSEKIKAISRVFANETAQLAAQNILKIVSGTGVFDQTAVDKFLESVAFGELIQSTRNIINDMDRVADFVFER